MNILDYENKDGTFTSPKNGKVYKSAKAFRSHLHFRKTEKFHNLADAILPTHKCQYCNIDMSSRNIKKHETNCYMNPTNLVECLCCGKPIKNFRTTKGTCSRSCANTYFRSGENNGNWKQDAYQSTCFLHHGKKCVICDEANIVDAHHLDENKANNDPSNLIPLCPTHHRYWHSRYKYLIEQQVIEYINNWKNKLGLA